MKVEVADPARHHVGTSVMARLVRYRSRCAAFITENPSGVPDKNLRACHSVSYP
jgi:hypothetical protein